MQYHDFLRSGSQVEKSDITLGNWPLYICIQCILVIIKIQVAILMALGSYNQHFRT